MTGLVATCHIAANCGQRLLRDCTRLRDTLQTSQGLSCHSTGPRLSSLGLSRSHKLGLRNGTSVSLRQPVPSPVDIGRRLLTADRSSSCCRAAHPGRTDTSVSAVALDTVRTDRQTDHPSDAEPSSSVPLIPVVTPPQNSSLPSTKVDAEVDVSSSSSSRIDDADSVMDGSHRTNSSTETGVVTTSGSTTTSSSSAGGSIMSALESRFSPRFRGLFLLNILTFLYGSNVTVVKEAEAFLDPFTFSLGRFGIAALAFSPFLKRAFSSAPVARAGIELGIWASLAYVTQAVGLITTEAGRASFIGTFTVIEVPIIAGLFGARIPTITWWAAAAAVLGVGLLESSGGTSTPMGDFWTIISALIFGFHMLRSEHHTRHVPEDGALPLIALQLFVTAAMSLAWLVGMAHLGLVPDSTLSALSSGDWDTISSWPWMQMAYTGVLSTAFCLWVEVVSLRDVSASEAAMVYTLEPLYGAGFAWVLLGERWGPLGWAGAALILGGSLTMQLWGSVESPADEPEEIESQKSSAAIVGALGAAAAVALIMAATGGVPQLATHIGSEAPVEAAVWSAYGEAEIDNLATFMRAYAMMKGDAAEDRGTEDGVPGSLLPKVLTRMFDA